MYRTDRNDRKYCPKEKLPDGREGGCKMGDDCLVLLSYVASHPKDEQSFASLAMETGIPKYTLWLILQYAIEEHEHSLLSQVARKHGYTYKINRNRSRFGARRPEGRAWLIDAVKDTFYCQDRCERSWRDDVPVYDPYEVVHQ